MTRHAVPRWSPAVAVVAALACGPGTGPEEGDLVARYGLVPLPEMIHPADNAPNPERIEVGRLLFFDPIMSGTRDVACGTCHLPAFAMTDGRALPAGPGGVGLGPDRVLTRADMVPEARNSPSVINAGFNRFIGQWTADGYLFWDGRIRRLENLVTLPQLEFSEMRADVYPVEDALDSVLMRIQTVEEYRTLFRRAFPERPPDAAIDSVTVSMALAQFVRSLVSRNAPYDRFVAGDVTALTAEQRHGLVLFQEKGGCARCHVGPMFSDFDFHVVGARQLPPGFKTTPHEDFGRWNVTHLEHDRWKFRTPSLRNVARTAPYTHSGAYRTLREMVEFFNRGGGDHPLVPRDRIELEPRGLSDREVVALVEFLESLTDLPSVQVPERVPSGLEPPRNKNP